MSAVGIFRSNYSLDIQVRSCLLYNIFYVNMHHVYRSEVVCCSKVLT